MKDVTGEFPPWWGKVSSLPAVTGVIAIYSIVNMLIRLTESAVLAHDDAKINVLLQSFQWGYLPDNPPLFEWLLYLVQYIAGPTLLSFLLLKYVLLLITIILTWKIIFRLTKSKEFSAFSVLSLLAVYQIGWNYHEAFTHSLVLICAIVFFLWAVTCVIARDDLSSYGLLGIAMGLGMLSKYNFIAAVLVIFTGLFVDKKTRQYVFTPKILVCLSVAILLFLPHLMWVVEHRHDFADPIAVRFDSSDPYLQRLLEGFPQVLWACVSFFLPLLVVIGLLSPRIFHNAVNNSGTWVLRLMLPGCVLLFSFVIVLGVAFFPERYAIAFLLPGFFTLMVLFYQSMPTGKRLAFGLYALCFNFIAIPTTRMVEALYPGPPFCEGCRQWVPFDGLVKELGGLIDTTKNVTLVGFDDQTAGNLRAKFPTLRVLSTHLPTYVPALLPSEKDTSTQCVFIWSEDLDLSPPGDFLKSLDAGSIVVVTVPWHHPSKKPGWRNTQWNIVGVAPENYAYNTICGTHKE